MNGRLLTTGATAAALLLAAAAPSAAQRSDEQAHRHQHGAAAYSPQQLVQIQRQTDALMQDLELMIEDIEIDGRAGRGFHQRADELLGDLYHFRQAASRGADREHLYHDFAEFDGKLHSLLEDAGNLNNRTLRRRAGRVAYADEQLHYAVFSGDRSEPNLGQTLVRQVQALDAEAANFHQNATSLLSNVPGDRQLLAATAEFAESAAHFHQTLESGRPEPGHLEQDFAEVQTAWQQVVARLNASPGRYALRRQAERINQLREQIESLNGPQEERHAPRPVATQPVPTPVQEPRGVELGNGRFKIRFNFK